MKEIKTTLLVIMSISLLLLSTSVVSTPIKNPIKIEKSNFDDLPYTGQLRVYVVEPISRWDNYDNEPYHFGFLDFALNEKLSIDYLGTYSKQVTWNAQDAGYSNVQQNNIMVIAAIFNPEAKKAYAYPPLQNPFNAYYVDAAAGATPGNTDHNTKNDEFTHTVFVEEGTATWCPYCPAMADALNNVYKSGEYPFYFVALIQDMATSAKDRLEDFNIYGYPTSFFDGGRKVLVGGVTNENTYKTRIEQCGTGDVHDLDLSLTVEWAGNGVLDISIEITNNEETPNYAPSMPIITGPSSGRTNKKYDFTFVSNDPEGGNVYYYIDWGDGKTEDWIGPYASDEEVTASHSWSEKNTFKIKAKCKDVEDLESEEATMEFSAPRVMNRLIFTFILEKFPILKNLFKY